MVHTLIGENKVNIYYIIIVILIVILHRPNQTQTTLNIA